MKYAPNLGMEMSAQYFFLQQLPRLAARFALSPGSASLSGRLASGSLTAGHRRGDLT